MVTVVCDKTGVTFEADSRRQKNHPRVSKFLNSCAGDKHNPGAYNMALAAFRQAKAEGMTDIDAIMTFAEQYVSEGGDFARQQRQERQRAQADAEKVLEEKRQRIKAERKAQNEFLRQHGYTWRKEAADFDEEEEGEPSLWVLRAPDGQAVSVAQALDEIARGAEVVRAEIAAQEAAAAAKAEAQRQEVAADFARREAAIAQVRALGRRVEPFEYADLPEIYMRHESYPVTRIAAAYLGELGGRKVGVVYSCWGGHDYFEQMEFWSE